MQRVSKELPHKNRKSHQIFLAASDLNITS
jgi:hypothetical protein